MNKLEQAANTAIFQRQMTFKQAVRFVVRESGARPDQAETALQGVMLWYRK
jgi:hypothetical protein